MKKIEKSKTERRFDAFCYLSLTLGMLYLAAHMVIALLQKGGAV